MKISRGKLLLLVAFLGGCAAQNAHRAYFEAETLMKTAMAKMGNGDPRVNAAFDNLAKGKVEMLDAKYDRAIRHFRESSRLSREATGANATKIAANAPIAPVQQNAQASLEAPQPIEIKPSSDLKKALPNEALAKYLAGKKAATASATAKPAAPAVAPTVVSPNLVAEAPSKALQGEDQAAKELAAGKTAAGAVIVAPATPTIKPAPQMQEDETLVQEALAQAKAITPKAEASTKPLPAGTRRKIPDAVPFIVDDPSIITEALITLNQTAKFLIENPSTSLILQGQLSAQEANQLLDERFESIKSYLQGKGVPEDQIQLDDQRKRGKNSEFEMFIVEH